MPFTRRGPAFFRFGRPHFWNGAHHRSCGVHLFIRLAGTAGLWAALTASASNAQAQAPAVEIVRLSVDRDDDDANGIPDREQPAAPKNGSGLFSVPNPARGGAVRAWNGVRIFVNEKAIEPNTPIPKGARKIELQAKNPGRGDIEFLGLGKRFSVRAIDIRAYDASGAEVDFTRSHASMQRTPPERLDVSSHEPPDPDALRFLLIAHADDLPSTIRLQSIAPSGAFIDALRDVPLSAEPCPPDADPSLTCASTPPLRAVADDTDRNHPTSRDRSIKTVLGGALMLVSPDGLKLSTIRIGGPRKSALGQLVRYRAKLRFIIVRTAAGGPVPVGGDDAGALLIARSELSRANALWGACGLSFGPPEELDISIADPPKSHLLAIGCDHGFPSSGGSIRFRIEGQEISVKLAPGIQPLAAARTLASAIGSTGFAATVSENPPIAAGAFGSADILVRKRDGSLASLEAPPQGPISSDKTLTACIGKVDLEDGLQHFGDIDAIAGTIEERTLIKAYSDGDPSTIEVFVIPSFAGGGRIGESFISADGGSIRNAVIEDRAGIRADRASFTLAHELGHVLLDDPGHPDDFGIDTPTRLMDADAANPTAYGPRRLLVDECVRAIRQSGPSSPVPLLRTWPFAPIGREK